MSYFTTDTDLIVIPADNTELCSDFDDDCYHILAEGYALECYLYQPKCGKCPFVGD